MLLLAASCFAAYEAYVHAPALVVPSARPAAIPTKGGMDGPDPADQAVLVALHQSNLWIIPTAQALSNKTQTASVKACADMTVTDRQALDTTINLTATALGVTLPDKTSPDRATLLPSGDKQTVNVMRREQGDLLKAVVADRVVTDDDHMRDLDNEATLTLERGVGYTEATGLVDYATLAPPAVSAAAVVDIDPITLDAAIIVLVVIAVLSAIFIRLLLRRQRKGSA